MKRLLSYLAIALTLGGSPAVLHAEETLVKFRLTLTAAFAQKATFEIVSNATGSTMKATLDGDPKQTRSVNFDKNQTAELFTQIKRSGFWTMPSTWPCTGCRDGSVWSLENEIGNTRRKVQIWSPTSGAFRELGVEIVRLSGLSIDLNKY